MTIFAVNAERAEQRESIAWLAAEAMYREVRLTPKPGLVDGENNGAHRDMNIALFMASIRAVSLFCAGKGDGGFACPADAIGDKAHRTGLRTGDVQRHGGSQHPQRRHFFPRPAVRRRWAPC